MTNERAAELLSDVTVLDDPEMEQAHKMAISALRQQDVYDKYVEKMTNADRIRAMTDEELAGFIMNLFGNAHCFAEGMFPYHPCPQNLNCKQCAIDWLQQPAKEDDHANLRKALHCKCKRKM